MCSGPLLFRSVNLCAFLFQMSTEPKSILIICLASSWSKRKASTQSEQPPALSKASIPATKSSHAHRTTSQWVASRTRKSHYELQPEPNPSVVSKDISTAIASKAAKPPNVNARNSVVFATADATITPLAAIKTYDVLSFL